MKKKQKKQIQKIVLILVMALVITIIGYLSPNLKRQIYEILEIETEETTITSFDLSTIPEYENSPYVYMNNNKPYFKEDEYTTEAFEKYSKLDSLNRCGVAYANICKEIMPKDGDTRESINTIKPSGWKTTKYEQIIDGAYLYNRCHLIGWQLAGENANNKNLITGTRYMNVEGMLPFENMVDDYFEISKNKNNHVLYRVTPIYEDTNLVASGVLMEAYSVEDNGQGVCFNVYVYNVQPGIEINYSTGESKLK